MRYLQWCAWTAAVVLAVGAAHAAEHEAALAAVPITRDLSADAVLVTAQHLPLLLVFAQDHCNFCDKLDREVLNPSYGTGAYNGKAIVRRFMIDSYATVSDFDGQRIDAGELSRKLKIFVTPTLIFVDAQGHELVPRIVGVDNIDFFAAYLDASIAAAGVKLRGD